MDTNKNIERKIAETLESLDGISRASAGHFFYAKLQNRLLNDQRNAWEKIGSFITRPVIALAVLLLILLGNGAVVYKETSGDKSLAIEKPTTSNIMDAYNQQVVRFYDPENSEP
jgi:hypothetical protein